ncbi:MAG: hypothetical protein ABI867_24985 [Kofleriaceae bacterium]
MGTELQLTAVEHAFFTAADQLDELATSYLASSATRATWWQRLLGRDAWPQLHTESDVDGYYAALELR